MKSYFFLIGLVLLSGCFQVFDSNDDLRTVPVTNNPTIVPNTPGIGTPY